MTIQFIADADTYLEFFERIKYLEDDTESNRIKLLVKMIEEGRPITVMETQRSIEQIVEDYKKHGDVLYLKFNGDTKNETKSS
jgi:hypothetical protein